MRRVKLGEQRLEVPAVGLGCMGMSDFYGGSEELRVWLGSGNGSGGDV